MATLTPEQIIQILDGGRDPELEEAEVHEGRLQLHTQALIRPPSTEKYYTGKTTAWNRFLEMVHGLLPSDKFDTFQNLVSFPLPTTEIVERAYEELHKVFQSDERVLDYSLSDEELKQDFTQYLESLGFFSFWHTKGWEVYQNYINSMIVIDLPQLEVDEEGNIIQLTEFPEPYFYVLKTEAIFAVQNTEAGDCEWVAFYEKLPEAMKDDYACIYVVIDSGFYRRFAKDNAGNHVLLMEVPHDLGYTPARMFWSQQLGGSNVLRQNQATKNLGGLDYMLFDYVQQRHLELYAGFPMVTVFEQDCNYREAGFECRDGYLYAYDRLDDDDYGKQPRECPKCKGGQNLVGPGTILVAPALDTDQPRGLMPMVEVTQGDIGSLDYMERKMNTREQEFMINMVGYGGDPKNDQAQNQKQIQGSFESRNTVMNRLARNFEKIEQFTLDTIGRMRYGERYSGSQVFYGHTFFLSSLEQMQESYAQSRTNGMPNYVLAEERKKIIYKEYQNNPSMKNRMLIMTALEPYESYTKEELSRDKDLLNKKLLMLKVNFNDLMQEWELENGPVQDYLPEIDFEVRVNTIKEWLMMKIDEMIEEKQEAAQQVQQQMQNNGQEELEENDDEEELEEEESEEEEVN
jgi:hypothetical protein